MTSPLPWAIGNPSYAHTVRVPHADFDDIVQRVRAALAVEGFGVLMEIDLRATLKKKLEVEVPRYVILGACNPGLAYQAVTAEPGIGALLPCNVVVAEEAAAIAVSTIDPVAMFSVVQRADIEPIAVQVRTKLVRALSALQGS
jgi:uncharacterized protein (DUF302 family)